MFIIINNGEERLNFTYTVSGVGILHINVLLIL